MLSRTRLPLPCSALLALPVAASAAIIGGTYYAPQYDFSANSSPRPTAGTSRSSLPAIPSPASIPTSSRATCCRPCRPPSRGRRSPSPTTRPSRGRAPTIAWCWSSIPPSIWAPIRCAGASPASSRAGRASSMSTPSTAATTRRCRRRPPGRRPPVRPIPRIQQLFRELFQVVFSDSPALRPLNGFGGSALAPKGAGTWLESGAESASTPGCCLGRA